MQEAAASLGPALESDSVTWALYLGADWDGDEFGEGDETIDDLTGQAGSVTIQHSMDDGLPDELSFMSGGVPSLRAGLAGKYDKMNRVPMTPSQYFSPFRTDSPLYGYERDVAPVAGEIGAVTNTGTELVTVFRGQMNDIPVSGGRATLYARSEARGLLSALVQPPVHYRREQSNRWGLTATWPIVWSLWACGVNACPPAQDGTRLWLPMHGGGFSNVPSQNNLDSNTTAHAQGWYRETGMSFGDQEDPKWTRGPFVGALQASVETNEYHGSLGFVFEDDPEAGAGLAPGDDMWSQAGNTTRFEWWMRGDSYNINTTVGGSADFLLGTWNTTVPVVVGWNISNVNLTGALIGVNNSRAIVVKLDDNTANTHLYTGPTVPEDGAWHACGAAFSASAGKVWFYLDGTVTSQTISPAITTANLPATNGTDNGDIIGMYLFQPVSDMHLSTGSAANPDSGNAWIEQSDWVRQAYVYPSCLQLEATIEPQPIEAWQLIAEYARSEFAALTIDENDAVHYWPRGYFATDLAQTVQQALTTDEHANLPDVDLDRTRIRTVCRVTYRQTRVSETASLVLSFDQVLGFPPGVTEMLIGLDHLATRMLAGGLVHLTAAQIDGSDPSPPGWSFITFNSDVSGSGTVATSTEIQVAVEAWTAGEAFIVVENLTSQTWYSVNDSGGTFPAIGLYAYAATVVNATQTEQYDAGVELRGELALTVNLGRIQREADAYRMARRIVVPQSVPIPVIRSVELFGDPRRQVGDLVTFTDLAETGADGWWRLHKLTHNFDGSSYTQTAQAQRARKRGVWGDGTSK